MGDAEPQIEQIWRAIAAKDTTRVDALTQPAKKAGPDPDTNLRMLLARAIGFQIADQHRRVAAVMQLALYRHSPEAVVREIANDPRVASLHAAVEPARAANKKQALTGSYFIFGFTVLALGAGVFTLFTAGGDHVLECQRTPPTPTARCAVTYRALGVELEQREIADVVGATTVERSGVNRPDRLELLTKAGSANVHTKSVDGEAEIANDINQLLEHPSKHSYRASWSGLPFLVVSLAFGALALFLLALGVGQLRRGLTR